MIKKYWVQYGWENRDSVSSEDFWNKCSTFVTTGVGCEFEDLEQWWLDESEGNLVHEIFQVVKL